MKARRAIAISFLSFATALLSAAVVTCLAQAGPPIHLREPALDISGLNHACGAAVDNHGDVYASSAGESEVKVYGEAHTELKTISNGHEPCGLAVDSSGNLYILERATGDVVKYHPSKYPPTASTAYTETTVDTSGNAEGIAVDPIDDRLYVAEGNRIDTYGSNGDRGIDEAQQVEVNCTNGSSFTLTFEGQTTGSIPCEASHAVIQAALEPLSSIGSGNVSVGANPIEPSNPRNHRVTFISALGSKDVPQLTGSASCCFITTNFQGWDGHIGEGELTGATGVAAYTGSRHYVSVVEPSEGKVQILSGTDLRALEPRATIDGTETPAGELGLASEGASLTADPGNVDPVTHKCVSVAEQGCTAGHLFVYDAVHKVVNEFQATGQYFAQIASPEFEDAEPTQVAIDRSGGSGDGTVYVSSRASTGAGLHAFGPVPAPSRPLFEEPHKPHSFEFKGACGDAVDSHGDFYVAGEQVIRIYDRAGTELAHIEDAGKPCNLAVDSAGNLYAADGGHNGFGPDDKVVLFEPKQYPFVGTPEYGSPKTIETLESPGGVAVNPDNDHLFVSHSSLSRIVEYDSAAHGSTMLRSNFCVPGGEMGGIDVYGANEDVYVARVTSITICDQAGDTVGSIDGSGSPAGAFEHLGYLAPIAVDQSNGHVLVAERQGGAVEEFEASGSFVARFGSFTKVSVPGDLAIDNSGGAGDGNFYFAFIEELSAFGPLNYGEPPEAKTGVASPVGGGSATLNGTVNPRGFELEECVFEWGIAENPYEHSKPCVESPATIGKGTSSVSVHVEIIGIEPGTTRYHFRLVASNKYGTDQGDDRPFGPPEAAVKTAHPILYREATLRGEVDPVGLQTQYRFEYLPEALYEQNEDEGRPVFEGAQGTPAQALPATSPATDVEAPLVGLAEGTAYRFRLLAANEASSATGEDPAKGRFTTLARQSSPPCPNATLRLENDSTNLPDCRAYELVTPADTRGATPFAEGANFNNWMTTPSGPGAGDSLAFFLDGTLPGTEGNGNHDGLRATRGSQGWSAELFSPSLVQTGLESGIASSGVSPDQLYSFWSFGSAGTSAALPFNRYLRTPPGSPQPSPHCPAEVEPEGRFEVLGCGSLGTDSEAQGDFISAGAAHVIFSTRPPCSVCSPPVQLEPDAPAPPLGAIYDRSPGGPTHVVSLLPGTSNVTPTSTATYDGATADGSSVAFSINNVLYVRRHDAETIEVAPGGVFSGISSNGARVFYEKGGALWVFDIEGEVTNEIVEHGRFVNISTEGSHAYFTSEEQLTGPAQPNAPNLYVWDGSGIRFVAVLATGDVEPNGLMDSWTAHCLVGGTSGSGAAICPSRTTSDGRFLVFESHADLMPPYEGDGHSEVYRYDAASAVLRCVSCDPTGSSATADAELEGGAGSSVPTRSTTVIPNVTEDGSEVVFQTAAALLPEDANSVLDVYEWRADGRGGCERAAGCLALISSGQGSAPSYLYSMTPDGHDVFFSTQEKLVASDVEGSASIYDARVEGGFPQPSEPEPCHGDACQGEASAPPDRTSVRSDVPGSGNVEGKLGCRKGRRLVRRNGKVRCVKRYRRHRGKSHRKTGGAGRRTGR